MSMTRARILDAMTAGLLRVEPFREHQLSVASYDVTLATELVVYVDKELDAAADNPTVTLTIPSGGIVLHPDTLYLASTVEYVDLVGVEAVLDGKSSLGRLGLSIHQTAGYLDPGFRGQVTCELSVTMPVRVYAGMMIGQIRFAVPDGPITPYDGRYKDQSGPTPSRSWMHTKRT